MNSLQIGQRHPHAVRLEGLEALHDPDHGVHAVVEQRYLVADVLYFSSVFRQLRPSPNSTPCSSAAVSQWPPGRMFNARITGESGIQPCTTTALVAKLLQRQCNRPGPC